MTRARQLIIAAIAVGICVVVAVPFALARNDSTSAETAAPQAAAGAPPAQGQMPPGMPGENGTEGQMPPGTGMRHGHHRGHGGGHAAIVAEVDGDLITLAPLDMGDDTSEHPQERTMQVDISDATVLTVTDGEVIETERDPQVGDIVLDIRPSDDAAMPERPSDTDDTVTLEAGRILSITPAE